MKPGDIVEILQSSFPQVPPGTLAEIQPDEPEACFLCEAEDCQEWPNLRTVEGYMVYHVSECQMRRAEA
jgi:hypothetical protein